MLLLTSNIEFYLIYISPVKKVDRLVKLKLNAVSKHLLNIGITLFSNTKIVRFVQGLHNLFIATQIYLRTHYGKFVFQAVHESRFR